MSGQLQTFVVTHAKMHSITVHPNWDDGREGFVWCRVDAMLDESIGLVAELTWKDDEDKGESDYWDPILVLETNTKVNDELKTLDVCVIYLSNDDAVATMEGDPQALLVKYAEAIKGLEKPPAN